MSSDWPTLLSLAEAEVKKVLHSLPRDLRDAANRVPVSLETRPNRALQTDGIEADTLGLFVGEPFSRCT
jgi:predicted Zn-dependent protease with MMP-like domain